MDRMNWWAVLAIASILGAIVLVLAGVGVQATMVVLTSAVVSAIFSARE